MLKTTTPTVDGRPIDQYLGVVVAEAILGANILKDVLGAFRDVVGGRSDTYEREMAKAREVALAEVEKQAGELGADGVVGISMDYEVFGSAGGMMMVCVTGTAVKFK